MPRSHRLEITDLPLDVHAEVIGLKIGGNGYYRWLVDGDGHEYNTPLWLLGLLTQQFELGRESARREMQAALGLSPEKTYTFSARPPA